MSPGDQPGRARRNLWTGVAITAGAVLAEVVRETVANVLASHVRVGPLVGWLQHSWLDAVLITLAVAGFVVAGWSLYRRRAAQRETEIAVGPDRAEGTAASARDAPEGPGQAVRPAPVTRTFPAAPRLVGRHADDCARAVALAHRSRVLLVTGASGGGTSAVATATGWKLAPDAARQRYVDLREDSAGPEDQRRTIIRVLRELGLAPDTADSPWNARRAIANALAGTGTALLLDNAESPEQVSWLMEGIPGAYVIACGDIRFGADWPRGAEHVRVGTLDAAAAQELLARQGEVDAITRRNSASPGAGPRAPDARFAREGGARARRWLDRLVRDQGPSRAAPPANTIARRLGDAPDDARRELLGHLGLPRVAIEMGRWLAANPGITVAELAAELSGKAPEGDLLFILGHQLDGTSPGARRLLRLLAETPVAELTEAAVARLAGLAPERAGEYLAELTTRSLVSRPRLSKCRITPQARQLALGPALADPPDRAAVAKSRVRLTAYYGRLAAVHGGDLGDAAAREWLSAEDAAMLQLLRAPEPPRRAAPHLWRIADVLDAWFAREQRPEDRRTAATATAEAAAALRDRPPRVTAFLRLAALARESGDFPEAAGHLERARETAGWHPALRLQVNAAWVAHLLVRGDPAAAEEYLLLCRQDRPRRDHRGRIADLVNQAVLQLRRGETDAANWTLGQAQTLAQRVGDAVGYPHVIELAGIVAALTGHPQRAEREWVRARELYEQSGDTAGEARCLQHHGTLLSTAPGGQWDASVAAAMLTRSLELRGERPAGLGPALAHLYLAEPEHAGGGGRVHRSAGLEALRAWPHQGTEPPEVTAVRKRLESA